MSDQGAPAEVTVAASVAVALAVSFAVIATSDSGETSPPAPVIAAASGAHLAPQFVPAPAAPRRVVVVRRRSRAS